MPSALADDTGLAPVLEDYFSGTTYARGLFVDRFGQLRHRFTARIEGRYAAGLLTLHHQIRHADGTLEQRRWQIRPAHPAGGYLGVGDDLIGTARGAYRDHALHWTYRMALPVRGARRELRFDDWMALQPGGILVHRSTVSKFGITLGEVSLFYSRRRSNAGVAPWPGRARTTV